MKVLLHQALSLCDHSVFASEAISLSRLQHPCLMPVLSCGLNPMNIVWEAAPGCSAMEHMDRCAPSPSLVPTFSPNVRASSFSELESGADDSDETFAVRLEW